MAKKDKPEKERNYKIATIVLSVVCIILAAALATVTIMLVNASRGSNTECSSTCNEEGETNSSVFTISDEDNEDWSEASELNIFYNEEFKDTMVAPGTIGSYAFTIHNETDQTLSFTMTLEEDNEYDIAMMYRLSRDGLLVVDNWSRVSEFKCEGLTINPYSSSTFTLEWWWDLSVNDTNDTLAGINSEVYTLSVNFSAISI